MALLNEPQSRAILCGLLDIHQRMAELEALIASGTRPSPFSKYVNDLSPTEAKVVHDYFARIRTAMLGHLRECEIPLDVRPTSLRWVLQCGITFIGITVDELRPEKLRGYGALDETGYAQVAKIRDDLERLVDQVAAYAAPRTRARPVRTSLPSGDGPYGGGDALSAGKGRHAVAACRVPAGPGDDHQSPRSSRIRGRGLRAGELRKVLAC